MLIDRDSQNFPERLREVKPKIKELYIEGIWESNLYSTCLSVVGSRRMSSYGKRAVGDIIPELINSNLTIVSGFMYGVDQEAHKTAVNVGGRTIAVLGWGIDRRLARNEERQLKEKILINGGAVMSEYSGESEAQRWMFAARNRIVAGLGEALLVVEAAVDSGSMITVNQALSLGKKVMAIPGPIYSSVSEGTNKLIKEGKAYPVTKASEVLEIMGIQPKSVSTGKSTKLVEEKLMKILDNENLCLDEIIRLMGTDTAGVLKEVTELEMEGRIVKEADKYRKA